MGSKCTCGKNKMIIQPIISFAEPKKQIHLNVEKIKENAKKLEWIGKQKNQIYLHKISFKKTEINVTLNSSLNRRRIKNLFVDPSTNRMVPNLKSLKNNQLYKKRMSAIEDAETDLSIRHK